MTTILRNRPLSWILFGGQCFPLGIQVVQLGMQDNVRMEPQCHKLASERATKVNQDIHRRSVMIKESVGRIELWLRTETTKSFRETRQNSLSKHSRLADCESDSRRRLGVSQYRMSSTAISSRARTNRTRDRRRIRDSKWLPISRNYGCRTGSAAATRGCTDACADSGKSRRANVMVRDGGPVGHRLGSAILRCRVNDRGRHRSDRLRKYLLRRQCTAYQCAGRSLHLPHRC